MKNVVLELNNDEALVLSEFLLRFNNDDILAIRDKSEEILLNKLACTLESKVSDLLDPNYTDLLKRAQKSVTNNF